MRHLLLLLGLLLFSAYVPAQSESFDDGIPEIDDLVEQCLKEEGVRLMGPGDSVACYNTAIFPSTFFKFNSLPETDLTIISSPGGHVITARLMATALDLRGGRVVIAGQCASACAMMLTPAIEDLHIHRTAHFAIHGITTLTTEEFGKWEKSRKQRIYGDSRPRGFVQGLSRGLGLSNGYYAGGRDQFEGHLKGQGIDVEYQNEIGETMLDEAEDYRCKYPPGDYWGLLDADYLRKYLGDQISVMEDFVQSYDHDGFKEMRALSKRIGANTYVFNHTLSRGGCL